MAEYQLMLRECDILRLKERIRVNLRHAQALAKAAGYKLVPEE